MLSQKKTNFYHLYTPHLKNITALPCKMQNFFRSDHALLKFSPCRNKTLPKLVRIADWYRNTDELWKRLVGTWAEFQQSVVDYAVDQWRKRLEACIRTEGGHFEHLLWRCLLDIPVATHHSQFFSEPPMFGGTQHYRQSDLKKFCILQGSAVTFSGVVGKGMKVVFFWDNVNNLEYVWIILLKMTFWISQGKVATVYWRGGQVYNLLVSNFLKI